MFLLGFDCFRIFWWTRRGWIDVGRCARVAPLGFLVPVYLDLVVEAPNGLGLQGSTLQGCFDLSGLALGDLSLAGLARIDLDAAGLVLGHLAPDQLPRSALQRLRSAALTLAAHRFVGLTLARPIQVAPSLAAQILGAQALVGQFGPAAHMH